MAQTSLRRPHPFCVESFVNGLQNHLKKEPSKTRVSRMTKTCQTSLRRPHSFCVESFVNDLQHPLKKEPSKTRCSEVAQGSLRRHIRSKTPEAHDPAPGIAVSMISPRFAIFDTSNHHNVLYFTILYELSVQKATSFATFRASHVLQVSCFAMVCGCCARRLPYFVAISAGRIDRSARFAMFCKRHMHQVSRFPALYESSVQKATSFATFLCKPCAPSVSFCDGSCIARA